MADDRIALLAAGRPPGTYRYLDSVVARVGAQLRAAGVGRGDRVAVVAPNGPEMASAYLAIRAVAACAPLNPAYTEAEFAFYLADLRPKMVIVSAGRG